MELAFKSSFFRDLDKIASREPKRELEKLIHKISEAHLISSVPRAKQLRRSKEYEYKIELRVQRKIYWILCDVTESKITFIRIKSEAWCKNNL